MLLSDIGYGINSFENKWLRVGSFKTFLYRPGTCPCELSDAHRPFAPKDSPNVP